MKVACAECGTSFEAKTRAATFCGATCRKRSSSRNLQAGKTLATVPELPQNSPPTEPALVAQTRSELTEAGVVDTVHGQIALTLAQKLADGRDTGSAMASLARQLSAAMGEALAAGTTKADSLDELAQRRMQKASGA